MKLTGAVHPVNEVINSITGLKEYYIVSIELPIDGDEVSLKLSRENPLQMVRNVSESDVIIYNSFVLSFYSDSLSESVIQSLLSVDWTNFKQYAVIINRVTETKAGVKSSHVFFNGYLSPNQYSLPLTSEVLSLNFSSFFGILKQFNTVVSSDFYAAYDRETILNVVDYLCSSNSNHYELWVDSTINTDDTSIIPLSDLYFSIGTILTGKSAVSSVQTTSSDSVYDILNNFLLSYGVMLVEDLYSRRLYFISITNEDVLSTVFYKYVYSGPTTVVQSNHFCEGLVKSVTPYFTWKAGSLLNAGDGGLYPFYFDENDSEGTAKNYLVTFRWDYTRFTPIYDESGKTIIGYSTSKFHNAINRTCTVQNGMWSDGLTVGKDSLFGTPFKTLFSFTEYDGDVRIGNVSVYIGPSYQRRLICLNLGSFAIDDETEFDGAVESRSIKKYQKGTSNYGYELMTMPSISSSSKTFAGTSHSFGTSTNYDSFEISDTSNSTSTVCDWQLNANVRKTDLIGTGVSYIIDGNQTEHSFEYSIMMGTLREKDYISYVNLDRRSSNEIYAFANFGDCQLTADENRFWTTYFCVPQLDESKGIPYLSYTTNYVDASEASRANSDLYKQMWNSHFNDTTKAKYPLINKLMSDSNYSYVNPNLKTDFNYMDVIGSVFCRYSASDSGKFISQVSDSTTDVLRIQTIDRLFLSIYNLEHLYFDSDAGWSALGIDTSFLSDGATQSILYDQDESVQRYYTHESIQKGVNEQFKKWSQDLCSKGMKMLSFDSPTIVSPSSSNSDVERFIKIDMSVLLQNCDKQFNDTDYSSFPSYPFMLNPCFMGDDFTDAAYFAEGDFVEGLSVLHRCPIPITEYGLSTSEATTSDSAFVGKMGKHTMRTRLSHYTYGTSKQWGGLSRDQYYKNCVESEKKIGLGFPIFCAKLYVTSEVGKPWYWDGGTWVNYEQSFDLCFNSGTPSFLDRTHRGSSSAGTYVEKLETLTWMSICNSSEGCYIPMPPVSGYLHFEICYNYLLFDYCWKAPTLRHLNATSGSIAIPYKLMSNNEALRFYPLFASQESHSRADYYLNWLQMFDSIYLKDVGISIVDRSTSNIIENSFGSNEEGSKNDIYNKFGSFYVDRYQFTPNQGEFTNSKNQYYSSNNGNSILQFASQLFTATAPTTEKRTLEEALKRKFIGSKRKIETAIYSGLSECFLPFCSTTLFDGNESTVDIGNITFDLKSKLYEISIENLKN